MNLNYPWVHSHSLLEQMHKCKPNLIEFGFWIIWWWDQLFRKLLVVYSSSRDASLIYIYYRQGLIECFISTHLDDNCVSLMSRHRDDCSSESQATEVVERFSEELMIWLPLMSFKCLWFSFTWICFWELSSRLHLFDSVSIEERSWEWDMCSQTVS